MNLKLGAAALAAAGLALLTATPAGAHTVPSMNITCDGVSVNYTNFPADPAPIDVSITQDGHTVTGTANTTGTAGTAYVSAPLEWDGPATATATWAADGGGTATATTDIDCTPLVPADATADVQCGGFDVNWTNFGEDPQTIHAVVTYSDGNVDESDFVTTGPDGLLSRSHPLLTNETYTVHLSWTVKDQEGSYDNQGSLTYCEEPPVVTPPVDIVPPVVVTNTPAPTLPVGTPEELAFTGSHDVDFALAGLGLVGMGGLMLWLTRPKRNARDAA